MATLFQAFQGSSMPKRLVRYALSRLDLLDDKTLDMDNLDLALGRNTVFEFRDVRIKLKKLEKLLSLPSAFKLDRARILLLRVTVPVDFYTSPIIIEVDGVDVRIQVVGPTNKPSRTPGNTTPDGAGIVPNTVDLAQSFLETQSPSERKELEDALAAEKQDLSLSVSDDGSEDEAPFGTGQSLSLPAFMAGFLQGIVDRMQVRIKGVKFQLDMEVPVELHSTNPEPISIQLALDSIDVEGVTSLMGETGEALSFTPKAGKRHVRLNEVRACLMSEASILSALAQSASPSLASSPSATRNPPSRESTVADSRSDLGISVPSVQTTASAHLGGIDDDPFTGDDSLGDSEDALAIPYDLSPEDEVERDADSPPTPRASVYHDSLFTGEQSIYQSTNLSDLAADDLAPADLEASDLIGFDDDRPRLWESAQSETPFERAMRTNSGLSATDEAVSSSADLSEPAIPSSPLAASSSGSVHEDLAQSQLYTHEEAASMYMSAFSGSSQSQTIAAAQEDALPAAEPETVLPVADFPREETTEDIYKIDMPGGWGEESEVVLDVPSAQSLETDASETGVQSSSVAGQKAREGAGDRNESNASESFHEDQQDDASTPRGPTRLVKEILRMKIISVYIPTDHQHIQVSETSSSADAQLAQSLAQSSYPQAPGAFSVYQSAASRSAVNEPEILISEPDGVLEVDLSPASLSFDASLGFLFAMVVGKLLEVTKTQEASEQLVTKDQKSASAPQVKLTLKELSINFLNRLSGVADNSERYLDPNALSFNDEVLLNATVQDLTLATSPYDQKPRHQKAPTPTAATSTLTKIEIGKFRFGYTNGDIISFDSGKPMSTSVRDTFLSSGHDIGIKIVQSAAGLRTDVETLPLAVNIDLQRLDETFSWFGGLSSFLNMSASMTSSPSPTRSVQRAPPKARGVRFETSIDPEDKSAASENKLNLRIGGALIEVLGKDCSLLAESSAVKVVSRSEGLGVAITMLRASGPYLNNSAADPAITTDVGGVRLDFLTKPRESDLDRLVELIVPSRDSFDGTNDELILDTLLRQRRKGSVLKVGIDTINTKISNMAQLSVLPGLLEELNKLSTVAKYLPEDDRPGLLTLGAIKKITVGVKFDGKLGHFEGEIKELGVAQITVPSLVAVAVQSVKVSRNKAEELVSTSIFDNGAIARQAPVIMARMIGDEIEPVIKLKLQRLVVEYRVPTIMDLLGLGDDATPQDFEESLAASVANLGEQAHEVLTGHPASPTVPSRRNSKQSKPLTLDVAFHDCVLGLNPHKLPAKLNIVLLDAHLSVELPKGVETRAVLDISKASVLLIDDVKGGQSHSSPTHSNRRVSTSTSRQVTELSSHGFVEVCFTSSAKAVVEVKAGDDGESQVDIELRDDLLVLETCADSMQTLIAVGNALKPPTPPSKENKFRTNVVPVQDLLASISAEAFGKPEGDYDFDQDFAGAQEMAGSDADRGSEGSLRIESQYYGDEVDTGGEELFDATKMSGISDVPSMQDTQEGVLLSAFTKTSSGTSSSTDDLTIHDNFFGSGGQAAVDPVAKVWNSNKNSYDKAPSKLVSRSPLKVAVCDVHVIWNLFDGYDWEHTRDIITKAVQEVESRAIERQAHGGNGVYEEEIEDEETIGDLLFNSIYIGIPANRDPQQLARAINEGLHDNATETESIAPTIVTTSTDRTARPQRPRQKRLRLQRSKRHKITFELSGVNVDMLAYPPGSGETVSSVDVRVRNVDVFDHVPTSTWRKFATYDQDAGEREMGTNMAHLEILTVKPLPELGASEMVVRVTLLPLRLHVDQDALDFITRFFEFKDDDTPVHASPSDVPFVQRAEVNDVSVKLDFKPKRVDYAGLRSGHTTEFMNFIVLEEARMVLRHVIIYGVSGFDRLGKTLNDTWTADVRTNQLPGVIAGLAPVRSLVNIGSGFKDLVEIPLREYQKDGRVFRSISKGAAAFARTTGTEIVKLGAKLAIGTQYALVGAEGMLAEQTISKQQHDTGSGWDDDDLDEEDKKQISMYADQPTGVIQGIRGGYRSLSRDFNLARDAIIAVPGEVMQSSGPGGATRAVLKKAPTIIFRPAVGVTKAIGQTLLGATNAMDPNNQRRIDEKYKKH